VGICLRRSSRSSSSNGPSFSRVQIKRCRQRFLSGNHPPPPQGRTHGPIVVKCDHYDRGDMTGVQKHFQLLTNFKTVRARYNDVEQNNLGLLVLRTQVLPYLCRRYDVKILCGPASLRGVLCLPGHHRRQGLGWAYFQSSRKLFTVSRNDETEIGFAM